MRELNAVLKQPIRSLRIQSDSERIIRLRKVFNELKTAEQCLIYYTFSLIKYVFQVTFEFYLDSIKLKVKLATKFVRRNRTYLFILSDQHLK